MYRTRPVVFDHFEDDENGDWREAIHALRDLIDGVANSPGVVVLKHPGDPIMGDSHEISVLRFAAVCVNRYMIKCNAPTFTIADVIDHGLENLVPDSHVERDSKMVEDPSIPMARVGVSILATGNEKVRRVHNRLLPNKARCAKCGGVVQSNHRHDFVSCECGEISLDGGNDYWMVVGDIGSVVRLDWDGTETCGENQG